MVTLQVELVRATHLGTQDGDFPTTRYIGEEMRPRITPRQTSFNSGCKFWEELLPCV